MLISSNRPLRFSSQILEGIVQQNFLHKPPQALTKRSVMYIYTHEHHKRCTPFIMYIWPSLKVFDLVMLMNQQHNYNDSNCYYFKHLLLLKIVIIIVIIMIDLLFYYEQHVYQLTEIFKWVMLLHTCVTSTPLVQVFTRKNISPSFEKSMLTLCYSYFQVAVQGTRGTGRRWSWTTERWRVDYYIHLSLFKQLTWDLIPRFRLVQTVTFELFGADRFFLVILSNY